MNDLPESLIELVLEFLDTHDFRDLIKVAASNKYICKIATPQLKRRLRIRNFARATLPKIILKRSLHICEGQHIIDMRELMDENTNTVIEARIIFNIQLKYHSKAVAIAVVLDSLRTTSAKVIWMKFFETLGVDEAKAATALSILPKSPKSFLSIDM